MRKRSLVASILLVLLLGLVVTSPGFAVWRHSCLQAVVQRAKGQRSVEDRLAEFGVDAERRVRPCFVAAGVAYPPAEVALLVFKDRKWMEVHARSEGAVWHHVTGWPILAASGGPGPKLREGDRQVPEGAYGIESLNPNSLFHVSLRLDYPNRVDRERAHADGRTGLGGDIMIHGSSASVGCLAMGDQVAEALFTLACRCGTERIRVFIAPSDPRRQPILPRPSDPPWVADLYRDLSRMLAEFPLVGG